MAARAHGQRAPALGRGFFPEFPAGPAPGCNWGQGLGDLEVDYQDSSADFWSIVAQVEPRAVITFSRGFAGNGWEVELLQHNHVTWLDDYTAPLKPTPVPPDSDYPAEGLRCSTLPMQDIVDRVNAAALGFNAYIDETGDTGEFLSEFMAYHGVWYRALHETPPDPIRTIAAGHVHVGFDRCTPNPTRYEAAAEETVRAVIDLLDAGQEVPPTAVRATSTGPTEVTLDWVGTSPGYDVLRAVGGCAGSLQLIGQTAALSFVDTGVTLGETYGYVIRGVDLCTADSACVEITHAVCDPATLNRVAGLAAVKAAPAGGVDLSWDPDPAAPPEYHVNSVAAKAELAAPNRGQPRVTAECTVAAASCRDADALSQPGPLFYQVLSACADVVGEEGPH